MVAFKALHDGLEGAIFQQEASAPNLYRNGSSRARTAEYFRQQVRVASHGGKQETDMHDVETPGGQAGVESVSLVAREVAKDALEPDIRA
jgi:hypothetical protein